MIHQPAPRDGSFVAGGLGSGLAAVTGGDAGAEGADRDHGPPIGGMEPEVDVGDATVAGVAVAHDRASGLRAGARLAVTVGVGAAEVGRGGHLVRVDRTEQVAQFVHEDERIPVLPVGDSGVGK